MPQNVVYQRLVALLDNQIEKSKTVVGKGLGVRPPDRCKGPLLAEELRGIFPPIKKRPNLRHAGAIDCTGGAAGQAIERGALLGARCLAEAMWRGMMSFLRPSAFEAIARH